MCPPPLPDISEPCSNEELIELLVKLDGGSPLPANVTRDVNPRHYNPENLPVGLWYFIVLQNHAMMEHGSWKPIGRPRRIFSNDSISGWLTMYEFHDPQSLNNSPAYWRMEEYTITRNGIDRETMGKDASALCRVYRNCPSLIEQDPWQGHGLPDASLGTPADFSLFLDLKSITRQGEASTSNRRANDIEVAALIARDNPLNQEYMPDAEWDDLEGNYLEMNDLVRPMSPSSSSGNSSCTTTSDNECSEKKGPDHRFDMASIKPNRILTRALPRGSATADIQEVTQNGRITIASSSHASTSQPVGRNLPGQEITEVIPNPGDIPPVPSRATTPLNPNSNTVAGRWRKGLKMLRIIKRLRFIPF